MAVCKKECGWIRKEGKKENEKARMWNNVRVKYETVDQSWPSALTLSTHRISKLLA